MTLQKSTIVSGNYALKAYLEEGVLTQASGVRELVKFVGNSFTLTNSMVFKALILFYPSTPTGTVTLTFEGDSLTYNVIATGTDNFFMSLPMFPLEPGTLEITTSSPVDKIVVVCERVNIL